MQLFLWSILLGVPLGMLYDCFRLLRTAIPHHGIMVFAEDTLFMLLSALMLECYGVMCARGAVRYYYAAGALAGFSMYLLTVGAVTRRLMHRSRRIIVKILRGMVRISRQIAKNLHGIIRKSHKTAKTAKK
ncbi:MAG: spore cortex biosynthesis protein YabQ [Oscillospiraceae bacterium]|nr:spore cortex biosynthesis protein YabQ [Oscillospiraceae bacterium]